MLVGRRIVITSRMCGGQLRKDESTHQGNPRGTMKKVGRSKSSHCLPEEGVAIVARRGQGLGIGI